MHRPGRGQAQRRPPRSSPPPPTAGLGFPRLFGLGFPRTCCSTPPPPRPAPGLQGLFEGTCSPEETGFRSAGRGLGRSRRVPPVPRHKAARGPGGTPRGPAAAEARGTTAGGGGSPLQWGRGCGARSPARQPGWGRSGGSGGGGSGGARRRARGGNLPATKTACRRQR